MTEPRPFYVRTRETAAALATDLRRRYDRLAFVRLAVFIGWLALLIVLFTTWFLVGLVVFLLTVPLIGYGVRQHLALQRRATDAEVLAKLAAGELRALDHDYTHHPDGAAFRDPQHAYALDLDLFGPRGVYQYLNRTVTAPGSHRLAADLLGRQDEAQRARTQVQGKELKSQPEWCLRWRTIGHDVKDNLQTADRLRDWLQQPPVAPTDGTRILLYLAPLLTLAAVVYVLLGPDWRYGALFFLPAYWMIRRYKDVVGPEHQRTAAMKDLLQVYADLLEHNQTRPGAESLPGDPPRALRRLAYLSGQLDVRYNPFSILLEIGGLWSLHQFRRLDAWRAAHCEDLPAWLTELARTDAYVSWATLRFNHPGWPDATFTDDPVVEAAGLGHPLLPATVRVTNDLRIRTDGHIHLITGSNMAGKSTWLRTVGLNVVLANAGGPVCATGGLGHPKSANSSPAPHLRLRPNLSVWTSMRTQDDLSESTSSFYAELKRLRAIIEAVSDPDQQVFFLLDEILKGTNSRDRHTGSRALIRQLIRERGAGIIATHDLELAALEAEPGSRVENYAMEVQVTDGELTFDYKLHPGVCQSFNATALMARMGIAIPEDEIKLHH